MTTAHRTSHGPTTPVRPRKRIIVCCDGTWMDSLGEKSEPPSNVTRISRVLSRTCSDGTPQVITYFAGVGTANAIDRFTGGAFGMGLDQDICEVYNFVCNNYVDGDDIVLIGFSRGAFTARSVADMIGSIGLLTPDGLDYFHAIFDDYENMGHAHRDADEFLVPGMPDFDGSHGQAKIEWERARMHKYKLGLKQLGFTRDTYRDGITPITIKALAVWDTVGALGIPPAPVIGVRGSADQWRFTNTQITDKVENAFQALALDEPRYAFRPSLWERLPGSRTNLKQVWFPGNHGNVGGGWPDQQIADITLAWMCDQLSRLGIEFSYPRMLSLFHSTLCYSAAHPYPYAPGAATVKGTNPHTLPLPPAARAPLDSLKRSLSKVLPSSSSSKRSSKPSTTTTTTTTTKPEHNTPAPLPWACPAIYTPPTSPPARNPPRRDEEECTLRSSHRSCQGPHPPSTTPARALLRAGARPWGLGTIRHPTSTLTVLAGKTVRRPGRTLRVDETSNEDTSEPLLGTGERVHASVRVRLVCGGLGLDDGGVWGCEALTGRGDSVGNGEGVGGGRNGSGNGREKKKGILGGSKKSSAKEGGGGSWRLERGCALSEAEEREVREVRELGPPEFPRNIEGRNTSTTSYGRIEVNYTDGTTTPEYPPEAMYPVTAKDHKWKWVWHGKVEGEGVGRVPQVLELPEEPLVGYWERVLLGLMVGEVDVWKYAQKGIQA
ncbi:hypothetical protein VTJ49DRAFT_4035 [Mycothermus thermophilus]|uniref:T6SS Phospholipase effector Tle1-like catalytic domain-containing protein n=1 Tax=Humicola insolens TaxID=85995 RepID=A0ABR3V6D3_HUMIN